MRKIQDRPDYPCSSCRMDSEAKSCDIKNCTPLKECFRKSWAETTKELEEKLGVRRSQGQVPFLEKG